MYVNPCEKKKVGVLGSPGSDYYVLKAAVYAYIF